MFNEKRAIRIEKPKESLVEIVDFCEKVISEWDSGIHDGAILKLMRYQESDVASTYYNQLKDIVLPEMRRLLSYIEDGTIKTHKRDRLHSMWYVLDCWDLQSSLAMEIQYMAMDLRKV